MYEPAGKGRGRVLCGLFGRTVLFVSIEVGLNVAGRRRGQVAQHRQMEHRQATRTELETANLVAGEEGHVRIPFSGTVVEGVGSSLHESRTEQVESVTRMTHITARF